QSDRPIPGEDPGGNVLKAHQDAVDQIVKQMISVVSSRSCVCLRVRGYKDPGSESKQDRLDDRRADAFFEKIKTQFIKMSSQLESSKGQSRRKGSGSFQEVSQQHPHTPDAESARCSHR